MLISLAIFSCKKSEIKDEIAQPQVEQLSEQRAKEKIEELSTKLLSSKNGWYANYKYNKGKSSVLVYFNFKDKNKVSVQSRIKGVGSQDSGYMLSYDKQVTLLFDPNSDVASFVEPFKRLDFKWKLVSVKENEIVFKNTKNKEDESTLVLRKNDSSHSIRIKFRHS